MTPEDRFEEQRHGFLMHYYDMAVKDLDRHLNTGWQSITVIAGGIVSISLGHKGDLPLPIAFASAIAVFGWGLAHVLDANYWAIRAIAFLANVESIYLAEEDRKATNPYVGHHPPAKMLDSLKHQSRLVMLLLGVTMIDYSLRLFDMAGKLTEPSINLGWVLRLEWMLPLFFFLIAGTYFVFSWCERLQDYEQFVLQSPGAGIAQTRSELIQRGVLLKTSGAASFVQPALASIQSKLLIATRVKWISIAVAAIFGLAALCFISGFPIRCL
jgi:hypothetical protein